MCSSDLLQNHLKKTILNLLCFFGFAIFHVFLAGPFIYKDFDFLFLILTIQEIFDNPSYFRILLSFSSSNTIRCMRLSFGVD